MQKLSKNDQFKARAQDEILVDGMHLFGCTLVGFPIETKLDYGKPQPTEGGWINLKLPTDRRPNFMPKLDGQTRK